MAKDYYQSLGLSRGASAEDVSRGFKKLARKHHPDLNPGDKKAEEKFKEISEAYEVLSNPEKKKKYDMYGSVDFEGFPGGGGGYGGGGKSSGGFDINDLGDIFGDLFGGGGVRSPRGRARKSGFGYQPMGVEKGKDLHFSIQLDFVEAVKGAEKTIRLPNGVGFKVKIPAGVTDGAKIRLSGKGEPGLHGGEAGDLYIEAKIAPHAHFRRDGDDIEMDLPITVTEVLEGGKIRVPTLEGVVELKIPTGAQSGQKMRLKGKGAPNMKTKAHGDLYVILQIKLPDSLDDKTKKSLIEMLKKKEKNPRKHLLDE
ncbi:MAG: J domain-containing protein [Deltaproteobacteria bacterium]|nr:J domain-containing protein [Deltaproteobacteria bacterium]